MDEADLYRAIRSLLADEPSLATDEFGALRGDDSRAGWADWGSFAALAAQDRWVEAREVLPALLEPRSAAAAELVTYSALDGQTLPVAWSIEGGGSAALVGPMLRLVGLAGTSAVLITGLGGADNQLGTWVEFIVRRGSNSASDCRLEISDGTVRETVIIDPENVRLLSNGSAARWQTAHAHLYGLLLRGQQSQLYADGQLILSSQGLPGGPGKELRCGVYSIGGADSESHWFLIRATNLGEAAARPRVVPPPWPVSVWSALIDELERTQELDGALTLAAQARASHPDAPVIQERLSELLERASARSDLSASVRSAFEQLSMSDRALMRRGRQWSGDVLLRCTNVGVRFRRTASSGRTVADLLRSRRATESDTFWAVRDVSIELHSGEMLGIVGRNGAGKSTLLHAIADLVEPDTGEVTAYGARLLLSTGAAFLPALTGRDNIYLSGLYLGLTRKEIAARFEEIVEFAELWDAIDRPVRTYSSGMTNRLQFSLATIVDPEILLLDELLGAGDAAFTEKAHARMHQLLRRARGVIVVTHDLSFVRTYCSKAMLLERGEVLYSGSPETAVVTYQDLLARKPKRAQREDSLPVVA